MYLVHSLTPRAQEEYQKMTEMLFPLSVGDKPGWTRSMERTLKRFAQLPEILTLLELIQLMTDHPKIRTMAVTQLYKKLKDPAHKAIANLVDWSKTTYLTTNERWKKFEEAIARQPFRRKHSLANDLRRAVQQAGTTRLYNKSVQQEKSRTTSPYNKKKSCTTRLEKSRTTSPYILGRN